MIIDTHAHYDDEAFSLDREDVLTNLKLNGVEKVINSGADKDGCKDTLSLISQYPFVYGMLGIHPTETEDLTDDYIEWLREQISTQKKIVAVGEIGLDYHSETPSPQVQQYWFRRQLDLAKDLDMPVVIHSRDAAKDTMDILKEYDGLTGTIHCYSYTKEMAKEYVAMGYYLGVGGVVTFKNARKLIETVEAVPLERILLETDAPYLSPEPYRGKRNDSTRLEYVAQKIAEIKNVTCEQVIDVTNQNAHKLYGKEGHTLA